MEGYLGYFICGIVVFVAIILSLFAEIKVSNTFDAYKNKPSSIDLTGEELAKQLAGERGVNINIGMCDGRLTDHYDPSTKTLVISRKNYYSKSIASQAIVAHEFGHALQDAEDYKALKLRLGVIKVSNFVSRLLLPIILIGILIEVFFWVGVGGIIIYAYVGIYALSVLVGLVTLPVEYNASSRAKKLLYEMGAQSNEEVAATDNLLNAAALTYVASLLVSMAFLTRLLYILFGLRR